MLTGLLAGSTFMASAQVVQVVTEPASALATRDSLLQTAAATRLELAQQTGFVLKTLNKSRRHMVRGYAYNSKQTDSYSGTPKRTLVWEHRTVYRRNGRVQEKYTAYMHNRRILEERWLNGSPLWMRISRPQDMKVAAFFPRQPAFNGTYVRGGYVNWQGKKYMLPNALHTVNE